MSFNLGLIAGIGSAQREVNMRSHEESIVAEKQKNDATANLLHDFMLRDDVTPDVKQAALNSLMSFSQTKGMPGQKHRAAALEPLLASMQTPRTYTSPNVQQQRQAGVQTGQMGGALNGLDSIIPGASLFAGAAQSQGQRGMSTPGETRSGFLRADERAQIQGSALGTQTRAMYDAMGGAFPGSGANDDDYDTVYLPNGKGGVAPRLVMKSHGQQQARYIDADGKEQIGYITVDKHNGDATDGFGRPVTPLALMTRDGYATMTGVDSTGAPTKSMGLKSGFAAAGPQQQYVPKRAVQGTTSTGDRFVRTFDPSTGGLGTLQTNGAVPNADVRRQQITTNTDTTQRRLALAEKGFAIQYDPTAYPGEELPAGQPMVDGNVIGTKQYASTREPGTILSRGSAAHSVIEQGDHVLSMVEDPKNADLFGKIGGRWSEFMAGRVGSDDPRLTAMRASVKSISDLLTTVHGRRAEQAAANFEHTMLLIHSPQALAAAIREYQNIAREIAAEAQRPTTTTSGRVPTRASSKGGANTKTNTGTTPSAKDILRQLALQLSSPQPQAQH